MVVVLKPSTMQILKYHVSYNSNAAVSSYLDKTAFLTTNFVRRQSIGRIIAHIYSKLQSIIFSPSESFRKQQTISVGVKISRKFPFKFHWHAYADEILFSDNTFQNVIFFIWR